MNIVKWAFIAVTAIGAVAMIPADVLAKGPPSFAGSPSVTGQQSSQGQSERPALTGPEASNKGGALRGKDRADEVAGSHGQKGRTEATTHVPPKGK